jgi:hypothetical protein
MHRIVAGAIRCHFCNVYLFSFALAGRNVELVEDYDRGRTAFCL